MNTQLLNLTEEEHNHGNIVDAMPGDKKELDELLSIWTEFMPMKDKKNKRAEKAVKIISRYNPQSVLLSPTWISYMSILERKLSKKGIDMYFYASKWEADVKEDLTTA